MHVITQSRIWDAKKKFPRTANALDGWYRIMKKNQFHNFSELKQGFNTVDKVDNLFIFDIAGNNLRLIASIHFSRQKIYIRHILTHREYEKNHWKK